VAKEFVPMMLPRGAFQRSGNDKGPRVMPEVVVPIRPGGEKQEPRLVFDPADMPRPRTIYPVLEPEPEPDTPPEPPGPTPEEIAQIVREAEERGYARGKSEMEGQLASQVEQEKRLGELADAVDAARAQWRLEVRNDVGRLVTDSVQFICGEIPAVLLALLAKRLDEAAEQMVDARKVVVRVAPRDVELVRAKMGERPNWEIRPDVNIKGGCRVLSDNGEIDGTLAAAFRAIESAAADWRAEVEASSGG
jgi:vacuolar-type H+-ATPase subunit E/Vma4